MSSANKTQTHIKVRHNLTSIILNYFTGYESCPQNIIS